MIEWVEWVEKIEMIELGKVQELEILREKDFGVYVERANRQRP